jgi:hypothetical protein
VEAYKNTYKCEQQKLSSAQKKGCVCHNNFWNVPSAVTYVAHPMQCNAGACN